VVGDPGRGARRVDRALREGRPGDGADREQQQQEQRGAHAGQLAPGEPQIAAKPDPAAARWTHVGACLRQASARDADLAQGGLGERRFGCTDGVLLRHPVASRIEVDVFEVRGQFVDRVLRQRGRTAAARLVRHPGAPVVIGRRMRTLCHEAISFRRT